MLAPSHENVELLSNFFFGPRPDAAQRVAWIGRGTHTISPLASPYINNFTHACLEDQIDDVTPEPPLSLPDTKSAKKEIYTPGISPNWLAGGGSFRPIVQRVSSTPLFLRNPGKKLAQRVVLRVSTPSRAPCLPWPPFAVSFPLFVKIMCVRTFFPMTIVL